MLTVKQIAKKMRKDKRRSTIVFIEHLESSSPSQSTLNYLIIPFEDFYLKAKELYKNDEFKCRSDGKKKHRKSSRSYLYKGYREFVKFFYMCNFNMKKGELLNKRVESIIYFLNPEIKERHRMLKK